MAAGQMKGEKGRQREPLRAGVQRSVRRAGGEVVSDRHDPPRVDTAEAILDPQRNALV